MILQMTGSKSQLEYVEIPKDDPTRRQPDISLAIESLGWQPQVALVDGLKATIDYFENLLTKTHGGQVVSSTSKSSARFDILFQKSDLLVRFMKGSIASVNC